MEEILPYLNEQVYLIFLISVMIVSGIMKKHNLLVDVFNFIIIHVKSNRMVVAIISMIGGILPIPGRVTVSAGILSMIAPCCSQDDCNDGKKVCRKSRSKFGIIDYLSTHHYYLWSPLEKTVVLPMAVLGISWGAFLGLVWPLIAITFIYIIWYIFWKFQESDIILDRSEFDGYNFNRIMIGAAPFFAGLGLLIFGLHGALVFGILALYYIILTKSSNIMEIIKYVNWWLVLVLALVLVLSVYFKQHSGEILASLEAYSAVIDINTMAGFLTISGFAFISSWLMGSSGKFAGIVALLVTLYGADYLVWFLVLEFMAYNLSPMHKCLSIGSMYFGTPIRKYFEAIIVWQGLLVVYAVTTLIW